MKMKIRIVVTIMLLMILFSACGTQSKIIDISVTGNMTIIRSGFDPDKTIENVIETTPSISIDDEKQILAILNGKELQKDAPACISDLTINCDDYMFFIDTGCGSVITTVDDKTMSCILSGDELAALLRICDAS